MGGSGGAQVTYGAPGQLAEQQSALDEHEDPAGEHADGVGVEMGGGKGFAPAVLQFGPIVIVRKGEESPGVGKVASYVADILLKLL